MNNGFNFGNDEDFVAPPQPQQPAPPAAPASQPAPQQPVQSPYQAPYQAPSAQQTPSPYQPPVQPAQPAQSPYMPPQPPAQAPNSFGQPGYPQPGYHQPPFGQPPLDPFTGQPLPPPANPAMLESESGSILTFGILSLALGTVPFISPAGIVFGALGKSKANRFARMAGNLFGRAKVGRILAKVGFIVGIVMTAYVYFLLLVGIAAS